MSRRTTGELTRAAYSRWPRLAKFSEYEIYIFVYKSRGYRQLDIELESISKDKILKRDNHCIPSISESSKNDQNSLLSTTHEVMAGVYCVFLIKNISIKGSEEQEKGSGFVQSVLEIHKPGKVGTCTADSIKCQFHILASNQLWMSSLAVYF